MAQSSRLLVASHLLRSTHNILSKKEKNPTIIMDRHFNFISHERWGVFGSYSICVQVCGTAWEITSACH